MDQEGKRRAGAHLATAASRLGWSAARLAEEADIDQQTVRDFMEGRRWPWLAKRQAMELAVGLEPGTLELAARGLLPADEHVDPVEEAIQNSALTRGNKAKLVGTYYDMLDEQQARGAS